MHLHTKTHKNPFVILILTVYEMTAEQQRIHQWPTPINVIFGCG